MSATLYKLTPVLLVTSLITACVTDDDSDLDDAVSEDEAGKADSVQAYRHYVLWAAPDPEDPDARWYARAGGGKLRCPDDSIRDACPFTLGEVVPTAGLDASAELIFDELADHPMIARGRLVRTTDRGVYLRASSLTRGITSVIPASPCYRLRPLGGIDYELEQLDSAVRERPQTLYYDDVDPTPDFWGQPTPAVQVKIDRGIEIAKTRPVYSCGVMDRRDTGDLFWTMQLFVPGQ